jgi:outer membrane lipoprotein LolB
MKRFAWLAAAVVTLAACSSAPTRRADSETLSGQSARESELSARDAWSLSGKVAVSDGRDGGSGRIDWRQDGERFRIEIRAPVTRRTYRLSGGPEGATLEGLDGGPRTGPDPEALLREAVGWSVPVTDMVAWARGARGQGGAHIEFDAEGRPAVLRQRGWTVEYKAWDAGTPPMPRKVFAANGERRVRLAVDRWDGG